MASAPASRPPCHPQVIAPPFLPQARFITPLGWALLSASLVAHLLILWLLPTPQRQALDQQHDILLSLKDPPPPPVREPEPEPARPELTAPPQPQLEAAPPLEEQLAPPSEPGPVIGVPGDGPGAVQSGTALPATAEEPPAPPPAMEPPPPALPPEPEPEPQVDVKALLTQYAAGVKAAILSQKYYPPAAERLGHSGDVKVSFTVAASGMLAGVSVKSSSGYDELDSAALDAVRRAAPFSAIPVETGKDELSLSITLKYSIN